MSRTVFCIGLYCNNISMARTIVVTIITIIAIDVLAVVWPARRLGGCGIPNIQCNIVYSTKTSRSRGRHNKYSKV